jgi:membrane protein YdbS with pleckstrin-like domain
MSFSEKDDRAVRNIACGIIVLTIFLLITAILWISGLFVDGGMPWSWYVGGAVLSAVLSVAALVYLKKKDQL